MSGTSAPAGVDLRPLGQTGLLVSPVCLGTSPLASIPQLYGYEVDSGRAQATIEAALRGPFNFIDTSNNYGGGAAEERIGRALAAVGGLPPAYVLATKVDADPQNGDFSAERVLRSADESLARLGVSSIELLYLHDPEHHLTFAEAMAVGGPVQALVDLRERGIARHLGIAGGPVQLMRDFVGTGVFEVVLSHNRFTLSDRSAGPLMDEAGQRGVAFVNGAPYGGGMLARGPDMQPRYAYRDTPEQVRDAVRAMQRACAARGVPLAAAALQFSVRDPRVASTVVGLTKPSRIADISGLLTHPVPGELWAELDALAPPPELWLH